MNIEQKNTLFVVMLVSAILSAAFFLSNYLIGAHVEKLVGERLEKSGVVFMAARKQMMKGLLSRAHDINRNSALRAAMMTRDMPTIESMMQDLMPHAGLDFVAYYQDGIKANPVGVSFIAHLASQKVLTSNQLTTLVRSLTQEKKFVDGHATIHGEFFHLVAMPMPNPLGGRIGVVLFGDKFSEQNIFNIRNMTGTEVAVFNEGYVIGSTFSGIESAIQQIYESRDKVGRVVFRHGGKEFQGKIFPLQTGSSTSHPQVLLAVPSDEEWAPYEKLTRDVGIYSLLLLLVASLVGISLSRSWLTRPIRSMAVMARAIGGGSFDVRADEDRRDEIGELGRSFNIMLTELDKLRTEEIRSTQRFTDFAESSSDWLWETDENGKFSYVSSAIAGWSSLEVDEFIGKSFDECFHSDGIFEITSIIQADEHTDIKDVEVWITTQSGMRLCMRISGTPYYENKQFKGYRGTSRDITKSKNDEYRLSRLATKDSLSGLSNRSSLMNDLERELKFASRQGSDGAILQIDIDHFKLLNDTAGHAAGDEVIIQIASLLRRLTRETDLVARVGGDEFVIVLVNTDTSNAQHRANEILNEIAQLKPSYSGKIISTTASIGCVLFPEHGDNALELLAKVETAMYAAKAQGRNRVHMFAEADMAREDMGAKLNWKQKIHTALEEDRFVLAFQAVAPTSGDPVSRYEVLVRMRGADGAIHMPGSFIPLAEQLGMIHQIDEVVVKKALRVLNSVSRQDSTISFSINLSGLSVGNPDMLRLIETELQTATFDRSRVIFEVTESAAFQDIGRATAFIAQIQNMGCRIALDDFGVGFSSFSYLKQLRADILKIDGSFIRDLHKDKHDQLFVKALVDVAKGMGMLTVAEFVEHAQCFAMIREFGVDYAQGYFVGKPRLDLFKE